MMRIAKTMVVTALALAALAFATVSVQANTYHHIDQLALKMQSHSRELRKEVVLHYRYQSGFCQLRSDALQLSRVSSHIQSTARQRSSVHKLQEHVACADRIVCDLQETLTNLHAGSRRPRHSETQRVCEVMRCLKDTLHQLRDAITSLEAETNSRLGLHRRSPYGSVPRPINPAYSRTRSNSPYGYDIPNEGLTFHGNGWTFRIGF